MASLRNCDGVHRDATIRPHDPCTTPEIADRKKMIRPIGPGTVTVDPEAKKDRNHPQRRVAGATKTLEHDEQDNQVHVTKQDGSRAS